LGAIILPRPLQRQIDELAQSFLQPQQTIDFSMPKGESALIPPESISWRIFKNPVVVFLGGVTAVLLEFAEPRVRDGIWQHSNFRTEPLTRLRRTGLAAMVTVYGPCSKAEAMIAGVVRRHDCVTGWTSEGEPYHANAPVLLNWVQATAGFGFTEAYHAYVRHLTMDERRILFAEARPIARLYGAIGAPTSQEELEVLLETMQPRLVASPIIFQFMEIMELLKAAVELLPVWVRERLGFGPRWRLRPAERVFVRALALASDCLILRSSPAIQSCRRLGLPDTYLFRRW
jgi:uncharacterized protein (DUF2236 family)